MKAEQYSVEILRDSGRVLLEYQLGERREQVWSSQAFTKQEYRNLLATDPLFLFRDNGFWYFRVDGVWFKAEDTLGQFEAVALAKSNIDKRLRTIQNSMSYVDAKTRVPQGNRKRVPDEVFVSVWKRDNGACVECGSTDDLQLDHIIPFSQGGGDSIENFQVLCGRCNRTKGASLTVSPVGGRMPSRNRSGAQSSTSAGAPPIQIPMVHRSYDNVLRNRNVLVGRKWVSSPGPVVPHEIVGWFDSEKELLVPIDDELLRRVGQSESDNQKLVEIYRQSGQEEQTIVLVTFEAFRSHLQVQKLVDEFVELNSNLSQVSEMGTSQQDQLTEQLDIISHYRQGGDKDIGKFALRLVQRDSKQFKPRGGADGALRRLNLELDKHESLVKRALHDCDRLMEDLNERPSTEPYWEHTLLSSQVRCRIGALEGVLDRYRSRVSDEFGERITNPSGYISHQLGEFISILTEFSADSLTVQLREAVGEPGQPGNALLIKDFAQTVVQIGASILLIAVETQTAVVAPDWKAVFAALSDLLENPIEICFGVLERFCNNLDQLLDDRKAGRESTAKPDFNWIMNLDKAKLSDLLALIDAKKQPPVLPTRSKRGLGRKGVESTPSDQLIRVEEE